MNKVRFTIFNRNGKKSLWVENDKLNIWDFNESELTENVKNAIISAFYRGVHLQYLKTAKSQIEGNLTSSKFIGE